MPLLQAVALQLLAALLAWFFIAPLAAPWSWVALQATLAALLAWGVWRDGRRALLHALPLPLAVLALQWQLPAWLYLLALLLTWALSRNALGERVPLYLSSRQSIAVLAGWLPVGSKVLDLGSGDGRVVLQLAALRPDIQVVGVENAPLPWLLGRLRYVWHGRPANVRLCYGNFWRLDWSGFDVIHVFLSPAPMLRVWQQFVLHGRHQGYLVSNSFAVDGQPPAVRLPLDGPLQKELLIWRHPHGTC